MSCLESQSRRLSELSGIKVFHVTMLKSQNLMLIAEQIRLNSRIRVELYVIDFNCKAWLDVFSTKLDGV